MGLNFRKFLEGIKLVPKSSSTISEKGDLDVTSGDGKLNYHNGTSASPIVTEAHSATLTNKNLSDSTTSIVDASDSTKQIKFDAAGTTGTSTTIVGSQTVDRTLTLPDATDTLVGKATSDTLTNKTFDVEGTGNSLSNVKDSNIKVGAAITRTKLASGTASHVLINDGSGVMSSESALAISRGGTGQATQQAALNALAPSSPAYGQVLGYDGTNWTKLTRSNGPKNYITYNDFENNAITGWNEASVTWSSGAPSGAPTISSSAAASISLATTNTNPLAGSYSLQMVGTIIQGQGFCTDALTIDREDRAKVLQGSFYYEVVSGASNSNWSGTSSNTLSVWIYDVTNSSWTQPAGVYNLVQSSGQGVCSFTFQTASDVASLRLFVFAANTASGSITVNFDDFRVGPQALAYGPAMSDWQTYTPTISAWSTNATATGYYRRVGDEVEVVYNIALSGAPTGNLTSISLPSGLSVDSTKFTATQFKRCGVGGIKAGGSSNFHSDVGYNNATSVRPFVYTISSSLDQTITATTPATFASGDYVQGYFRLPIQGWSSNTLQSADTDTRVVAAKVYATANTSIPTGAETAISFDAAAILDSHGAWDGTSSYVAPVSGYYEVTAQRVGFAINGTGARYLVVSVAGSTPNANLIAYNAAPSASVITYLGGTTVVYANAGQAIQMKAFQNSGGALNVGASGAMTVKRLSGPATIQATETVAAGYEGCVTTLSAGGATLIFPTKLFDTHGSMNTFTGVFTVPVTGKYRIDAYLLTDLTTGVASVTLSAVQSGSLAETHELNRLTTKLGLNNVSGRKNTTGTCVFNCVAGDSLTITASDADAINCNNSTRVFITKV